MAKLNALKVFIVFEASVEFFKDREIVFMKLLGQDLTISEIPDGST